MLPSSSSSSSASSSSPSSSRRSSRRPSPRLSRAVVCLAALASASPALAQSSSKKAGTFAIVGNSGVSAQQLFLGAANKVYIVDKTENNPMRVTGASGTHAAWGSEYKLSTNEARAMDIVSNSFCAGGTVLGNGTWLNVGGNQAVTWGGLTAASQTGGQPYDDFDGGKAVRLLDACNDNDDCEWIDRGQNYMNTRRWYPTLETLEDGSAIIIGGCQWGGYVNDRFQSEPTYEFFPSRGAPVTLNLLLKSLPANLYSLTWLLPSGNLFIQTNWNTEIFDYKNNVEYSLDDIPFAVRTYPASGATAMLPLTPANNWTATVLFCGGTNLKADQWVTTWNIAAYPADSTCVKMTPDVSVNWVQDDSLDTGRTMGQFIALPDGRLWMGNGAHLGTAGYGNDTWAVGRSYADQPNHQSWYYDGSKPSGSRWAKAGVSTVDRLYHSSATLLPDGSVLVSGSNPNPDYVDKTIDPTITYVTEYKVEIFYPDYMDKPKPVPTGLPTRLSYGGAYFNVTLPASTFSDLSQMNTTTFVLSRTGFSTHAMNMGMRHVELDHTYSAHADGSVTYHVSQLPPNPAILVPGPALFFVVVGGVPSQGAWVNVGSGKIETQPLLAAALLPETTVASVLLSNGNAASSGGGEASSPSATGGSSSPGSGSSGTSAGKRTTTTATTLALLGATALALFAL